VVPFNSLREFNTAEGGDVWFAMRERSGGQPANLEDENLPSNSLWARAVRSGLQVRPALGDPPVRGGRSSVSPRPSYPVRT
jgi:hypothetical protein